MKRLLKDYFTFTRTERYGIVALLVLLIILVSIRATMHLWMQTKDDHPQQQRFAQEWQRYKERQKQRQTWLAESKTVAVAAVTNAKPKSKSSKSETIHANLNTVDSATLTKIKGIGPKLAHRIITRRAEIGKYTSHEQLLEVYHFSDEVYSRLQQMLYID